MKPDPKGSQHLSQVHAVTLVALRRTTLLDLYRVAHNNAAWHAKHPRDGGQHEAHKRRKTEGPLKDMGDVIVSTGL